MAVNLSLPPPQRPFPETYVPGTNPDLDAQIAALQGPQVLLPDAGGLVPPMPSSLAVPAYKMPAAGLPEPPPVAVEAAPPIVAAPPVPVAAPAPVVPAGPDYAKALAVGPDTKVTRVKPTDGFNKARQALDTNDEGRKATSKEETDLNARRAGSIVDDENQFAADRAAFEERETARRTQIETEYQAAKDAAKTLREQHGKDYEKEFFAEKGVAKQWLAALAVGLGAYSAARTGGPNYAYQILKDQMDAHSAREKGRLLRQKEEIERRGQDATAEGQRLRDYDTITRPHQEAALLQRASERRRQLLASYGVEAANVEGDKLLQQIEAEKQARVLNLEAGLAARVETDNSEQNKLKRAQALGVTGEEKLTERQQVAATGLGGALQDIGKAHKETKEFTNKDREIIANFVGEARQIKESDPERFRAAINKLGGNYYTQLSANGRKRFDLIQNAAQDMERVLSGGVINAGEYASRMALASEPGGLRHMTDRARAMATGLPPQQRQHWNQQIGATEQGFQGGAPATTAKQAAEVRAAAVTALRGAPADQRGPLEWVRDNPTDPRAAAVLTKLGLN
jgi:hypothetical protein